ncbi:MAG: tetratricopeptide repeat protein, partial [Pseudomonadota bacterium]|nr:tetratricopeptide repeat protein [Pseudomonadota bacterium]
MSKDVASMNKAAVSAMAAGDMRGAHSILMEALERDRANIRLWLNLAIVRRQLQDIDGAFAALREVLLLDNRNFPALLMR